MISLPLQTPTNLHFCNVAVAGVVIPLSHHDRVRVTGVTADTDLGVIDAVDVELSNALGTTSKSSFQILQHQSRLQCKHAHLLDCRMRLPCGPISRWEWRQPGSAKYKMVLKQSGVEIGGTLRLVPLYRSPRAASVPLDIRPRPETACVPCTSPLTVPRRRGRPTR